MCIIIKDIDSKITDWTRIEIVKIVHFFIFLVFVHSIVFVILRLRTTLSLKMYLQRCEHYCWPNERSQAIYTR